MNRPIDILFMITDSCNCECPFCSRKNLSLKYKEPSLECIKKALSLLSSEFPQSKLILTGGEPSQSKSFIECASYAMSQFRKVEIQTNGTFSLAIASEIKPLLKQNLFIQFSLDGPSDYHDSIRGNGVFKRVIDNLVFFSDECDHISISMTVTFDSRESAFKLAKDLNQYRFKRLTVSYVQPLNPREERILNSVEWNPFVDELLPLCNYRVDIAKLYDFDLMEDFVNTGQSWDGITNCGRGKAHFYVTPTFDVLPCTCLQEISGNLLIDEIRIIKEKLNNSGSIAISDKSPCKSCKYLSICNGGCPGMSTKVFGVSNMGDIRCPIIYKYAQEQGII